MKRIGILCTHAVQYHSPLFRAIAQKADLKVYYCLNPNPQVQGIGFGRAFSWDIPLFEGYSHEFLQNISTHATHTGYLGCDTPEIDEKIRKGDFDLFILFGWYYKSAHQALKACEKYRVPIYARGDSQLSARPFWIQYLKQIYFRRFLSRFNGFLSPGVQFKHYLKFYGVSEEKIIFCPQGVDNDFFDSQPSTALERENLRTEYGIRNGATVFLYCGKFIRKKRPLDFLKALSFMKKSSMSATGVLLGDGPLKRKLQDYALKSCLDVRFLGFVNQKGLPKFYRAADCLVLPSDGRETWGLVVNEAFASGIPAIVSDEVGCGNDLLEEGRTGFRFKCGDAEDLGNQMKRFIQNSANRHSFEEAVLKKAREYSVGHASESILTL